MGNNAKLNEFKKEMETLRFREQDGSFIRTNRSLGYDNDCSDDERDDCFYEEKSQEFHHWADPIANQAKALAKKCGIKVEITTSAEYGDIYVNIKE